MKKVFTNSAAVIHLFAQRSQDEAKCSNVFFDDKNRIYSYGRHYLLAEFITNEAGDTAILINNAGYSVTTAKHIREITAATRQYKQFFELDTNPVKVVNQLTDLASKLQTARKPEKYINPAEYLYKKFTQFETWRGETNDKESLLKINELIRVFRGGSYIDYIAKQSEIIKQAEKILLKKAKKDLKKALKSFFQYKINYVYNRLNNEDFCRLSIDGQHVETTQNIKVSVKTAKVLYQLIKAGKDIKGFNIDGYTVISLNGVLKIGCHNINRKNMVEIGEKLLNL